MQMDKSWIRACLFFSSFSGLWALDPATYSDKADGMDKTQFSRGCGLRCSGCERPRVGCARPAGVSGWALTGNANTTSGATGSLTAGVNFIGTTDAQNLEVRLGGSSTTFFRFTQQGGVEFINPDANIFVGLSAGFGNTGEQNTAIGTNALSGNSSGNSNTAVGSSTMILNDTGAQNCAFGQSALLFNRTGNNNVAIGYFSLRSNQNSDSTAIGANALQSNISGDRNTAVGAAALTTNTNGSDLTCVGYGADVSTDGLTNASAFGSGAIVTASNAVVIGNSSVTSIGGYANWSNLSDGQFKTAVQENVSGLAFIRKLRPITYRLDMAKLASSTQQPGKQACHAEESEQGQIVKTGLIAQEVERAALEVGYDFDGVVKPQHANDHYRLCYASFVVPLIKAIQEQQAMIEALQFEIQTLKTASESSL